MNRLYMGSLDLFCNCKILYHLPEYNQSDTDAGVVDLVVVFSNTYGVQHTPRGILVKWGAG